MATPTLAWAFKYWHKQTWSAEMKCLRYVVGYILKHQIKIIWNQLNIFNLNDNSGWDLVGIIIIKGWNSNIFQNN